ncbi:site-specific integrase [Bacillus sp. RSS_NA_20]|uniref:site-specific integrase n=1 Tax=Bacillus sp. RSS_NA_20 TaxID=2876777 RepID=UPI001CCE703F|nr:site-specific integrase [Bacillus sp. RSS_NA_20]MCA0119775.1 site-specific integrase [Bacillus sp. RSS_NA_20]
MANTVDAIKNKRDIERMKKALHGRDLVMFVLGVSLGLRISDLLTIRVGDLRGQSHLAIKEGKTGKTRDIKLSSTVVKLVQKLDGDDDSYVFQSRKGVNKPISRVQAYRVLNAAAVRAGINIDIGTHTLRKTFGYQLYSKGINITRIMKVFGHSSEAQTLKYIGITADEINAAYEAIEI